jgi:putative NADPH-quinone reductase
MRILIVQGHPDNGAPHLCHALAQAYAEGAREAGHTVDMVAPASLAFPLLASGADWEQGSVPAALQPVQELLRDAQHLVLVYPLWLGGMPALLKGFLEQLLRPGFALERGARNPLRAGLLAGRSARVVLTMGMPALFYRLFYGAPGLRMLERHILRFVGFAPVRSTVVGSAARLPPARLERLCRKLRQLGAAGR